MTKEVSSQAKTLLAILHESNIEYKLRGWRGNEDLILSQKYIPLVFHEQEIQKLKDDYGDLKILEMETLKQLKTVCDKVEEARKILEDEEVWDYHETEARQRLRTTLQTKKKEDQK